MHTGGGLSPPKFAVKTLSERVDFFHRSVRPLLTRKTDIY